MPDEEKGYLVDLSDGVLTLSFNRPEAGNALPPQAVPHLLALLEGLPTNPEVRVLVVRGEGANFSVGGDIRGFARQLQQPTEQLQADFAQRLVLVARLAQAVAAQDIPIIAACRGATAGAGLMWVLGADVVVADESACFSFAHQRVGLTPDGAVSYLLPRVVGLRRATELIISAARVDAQEAWRIGIVSRIVPALRLDDEAREQARRFARAPRGVLRRAKRLLAESPNRSLAEQLAAEREAIITSVADPDFAEGVNAFLEGRAPSFPSAR
jgi:2-(1,2-epoxy-1,2-dihydrophenyl)acetyl-CoA isomerase